MSILTDLISKALRVVQPKQVNAQSAPAVIPAPTPNQTPVGGAYPQAPNADVAFGQHESTGLPNDPTSNGDPNFKPTGGSSYYGPTNNPPPATPAPTPTQPTNNYDPSGDANRIQSEEDKALQAAIGVFDARKAGIMNQIPGLQSKLQNTLSGYDANLTGFQNEADRAQTQKINDLGVQENTECVKDFWTTRDGI
jgi:hypothetical protein